MANTVDKVIKVADNEVGYIEKKSNKNLDSKTANAGDKNYTKYGAWIGMNGTYWCASSLCWFFYTAYGTEIAKKLLCGNFSAACETIRQNFIKNKQYYESNPKIGDVIFFKGTRHAGANHIGLVYKVDKTYVYTIEGNTSSGVTVIDNGGEVAKKKYLLTNTKLLGYGRPKYDTETVSKSTKKIEYYPKCDKSYFTISSALESINVDSSKAYRKNIANANGIVNYTGTLEQNNKMLNLLQNGKLIKP